MIPYVPQPVWSLGPLTIHAFGLMAALALLTGYRLILWRSRAFGVDRAFAGRGYAAIVIAGLLAGWMWARLQSVNGVSGTGLAAGGCVALIGMAARRRLQFWSILDLFAFAFPVVLLLARIGCFLAHDHIGAPTNSWIGVGFPGGTRFDLGLLYALGASVTAPVLVDLQGRQPASGITFAAAMGLLGLSRIAVLAAAEGSVFADNAAAAGAIVLAAGVLVSRWKPLFRSRVLVKESS